MGSTSYRAENYDQSMDDFIIATASFKSGKKTS